jgi:hypothetical protein
VDEATGRDRATIGSGDGCFHCSNETGSVQWKPKLAPALAVSGVFGGPPTAAADRALATSKAASRTWARSASPGAISVQTGAVTLHFVLSSASRDNLGTFRVVGPGASPRRGTGVWKEILYVAGEDGYLHALNASVAGTSVT